MSKNNNFEEDGLEDNEFSNEDGFVDDLDIEIEVDSERVDIDIDIDIIIENDAEEVLIDIVDETPKKISKHKESGKHSLKYDSIFKGKKDDTDLDEYIIESANKNNNFEPNAASSYAFERESPTEYVRLNNLKKELYNVIVDDIKLNIKNSRRKPSRVDFNKYYSVIVSRLDMGSYSYSEVFIEFAYYFSDNIENMFKLLDKKWGGKIAQELARKGNIRGVKNLDDIDFL